MLFFMPDVFLNFPVHPIGIGPKKGNFTNNTSLISLMMNRYKCEGSHLKRHVIHTICQIDNAIYYFNLVRAHKWCKLIPVLHSAMCHCIKKM